VNQPPLAATRAHQYAETVTSPSQPRPRAVWDIVLSIVFLVIAVVTSLIAAISQLFVLAFTDYCPAATCNSDEGVTRVLTTWTVIAILLIASIVFTIVLLVKRRRAWWVAMIGLLVVIIGAIVGFVLYLAAVGYGS
jgi:uncharacterized BrkB/YihY/UPF0761 family membrane protein